MSHPPQHSRTDLADLKSQIARKLGSERARRYFNLLNRLLCQKLSKIEFDKLCLSVVGQDFVPLHNQFIRSILRNAHQSTAPIPQKPEISGLKNSISLNEVPQQSQINSQIHPAWSNGDILPPSPRKSRSTNRRTKDRPSPLGPNGVARYPVPPDEAYVRENGHLKKPSRRLHLELPGKLHGKPSDADETEYMQYDRGPIKAPLGIPFCPASVGGARYLPPPIPCSNYAGSELGGTEALRKRMEQIAEAQGLGGVSMDCADLLNNGLDAYLKRLIRSCADLAGSRPGNEPAPGYKQQGSMRNLNGVWQGHSAAAGSLEGGNEGRSEKMVSLLDFRVAMELKPQQLGEDWPLLLEKVCNRSFEE